MKLKNFKMTKKLNFYLLTTLFFLILISCSKDNGTESLIEDKLETMSSKEILRELLIKNDNDINQLARIFECSPSSLKRILESETFATSEAENQFKNVLNQTLITKDKTLDELDPKYKPLKFKIKRLIEQNYIKIGLICLGLIIIGLVFPSTSTDKTALGFGIDHDDKSYPLTGLGILAIITILLVYFILVIIGWLSTETIYKDLFVNSFDPIWEQLK
ncbi:hypothetical protein [Flavobacterium sp. WC2509]|uniref:hypothetical protein n=1 Tax=Flavobacterium sp. WC2509 TaxID=3461406 RepID=UPI0040441750